MNKNSDTKEMVKKIQEIVYAILCDVDDFCKENDIMYFLSGGTCLGAVRHNGFIPWDDDADIMMPRDEYEKFLKLYNQKSSDRFKIGALELTEDWNIQYARIWDITTHVSVPTLFEDYKQGVSIDVFPIDGLPDNKIKRKIYYKKIDILRGMANSSIRNSFLDTEKNRIVKRIAGIFTRLLGARFFAKKMDVLAHKYKFRTSKYVGASLAAHYGARETIKREQMSSQTFFRFVDREFPVPIGYDEYLKNLYDDYMKIPNDAAEKGYSHLDHRIVKFDTKL